jgi:hypothetical protein
MVPNGQIKPRIFSFVLAAPGLQMRQRGAVRVVAAVGLGHNLNRWFD